jgi:hypothetical protein
MKNKQTAVDWVVEQLTPAISLQQKYIDEIKQYAKSIEQQQTGDWVETHWYEEIDGKKYKLYYDKNNEWK